MSNKKYIFIGISLALFTLALFVLVLILSPKIDTSEKTDRTYCTAEEKNAEACITLYSPVCAIRKDNINLSYANSCFACMDEQIDYWKEGSC
jgi:hypothetical protein